MADKQSLQLEGELIHIVYTSEETGFTVAHVQPKGQVRPATVVGKLHAVNPGVNLQLTGHWVEHKRFGKQFQVDGYAVVRPATVESIHRYLSSGLVRGIGPVMAKRIVDRFGEDTLDVIETEPERLAEVGGFGPQRIARLKATWQEQREIRQIMMFLQEFAVGPALATKIYKQYGAKAISLLQENPYRLAGDVIGVGFKTADRIARAMGIAPDSEKRAEAGILFVLQESVGEGNVFLPYEILLQRGKAILEIDDEDILRRAVADLFAGREIHIEDFNESIEDFEENRKAVYLPALHKAEKGAADALSAFVNLPPPSSLFDPSSAVREAEKKLGISFAAEQREAVESALKDKCLVITGGPGTGKTTLVRILVTLCRDLGSRCLLAAPTGRAAKRLHEVTGHPAGTIHRLLEYSFQKGRFARAENNPLEAEMLIVDEASMIDTVLFYHLVKALPSAGSFVLIGDVDQLPSVGPGRVLADLIDCGRIRVIRLSQVFRQANESLITTNAHRILEGKGLIDTNGGTEAEKEHRLRDFYFIEEEDPEQVAARILHLYAERIPERFGFDPLDDIQVISPMHRGAAGAENLNALLQAKINPEGTSLNRGGFVYRNNDKVMQIRNNYEKEVFNGDIGRIVSVDAEDNEIVVRFDERMVPYDASDMDELVPAYAITVHKSQGNEYPAVIMPLTTQHYMLLQRNLLYTALTRGKRLVVLVGTRKAMGIAIRNTKTSRRFTLLRQRLCQAIPF